ncbi:MAG: 1-(5-phosphoribosyl)-5-[(5-phosphoribosylamino)methylideneamino]imidazole-4-carboxamide isomerase [Planctomycetaceae bacterium]
MQILPAIDIRGGQCVRLRQGDYGQETVFGDDPIAMAQKWEASGGDRIHIVDLDGAKAGKPVNLDAIRGIAAALSVPIQVGGGIRNDDTVKLLLEECGVDRVIIGTQALKQPEWFSEVVNRYPNRVALGLDARDSMVATEGWLDVSKTSAIELAKQYVGLPLGAVIYTNIANDGMMQGIDEATIQDMLALAALGLPVIASGGVTTVADITRLAEASVGQPNLVGAITGRALYEGTLTVAEAVEAVKAAKQ